MGPRWMGPRQLESRLGRERLRTPRTPIRHTYPNYYYYPQYSYPYGASVLGAVLGGILGGVIGGDDNTGYLLLRVRHRPGRQHETLEYTLSPRFVERSFYVNRHPLRSLHPTNPPGPGW